MTNPTNTPMDAPVAPVGHNMVKLVNQLAPRTVLVHPSRSCCGDCGANALLTSDRCCDSCGIRWSFVATSYLTRETLAEMATRFEGQFPGYGFLGVATGGSASGIDRFTRSFITVTSWRLLGFE